MIFAIIWDRKLRYGRSRCAQCPAQCDAWRPLRLPAVLVGDGRLGGISTTLAAADSLLLRGYDLAAVAVRLPTT